MLHRCTNNFIQENIAFILVFVRGSSTIQTRCPCMSLLTIIDIKLTEFQVLLTAQLKVSNVVLVLDT